MSSIIEIEHLSKQYDPPHGPWAVREVTLSVEQGEILGLLGKNGAGKTTLINLLCGLLAPTGGTAHVGGYDVVRESMTVKRLVGVVPQETALYPDLSGRQNLSYFGQLCGLGGRALHQAIAWALTAVDMTDLTHMVVHRLSNGMKRRLNIAVALLHRPPILLMDEPTVGLDADSRRRVLDIIIRLKRESNATVLYATHHLVEAQELCDRVAIMHKGRIFALGRPEDLIRELHSPDTVRIWLAGSSPTAVVAALRRIPAVREVAEAEGTITLSLFDTANVLPLILSIIRDLGVSVQSFAVARPGLDAVFERLTGEQLEETP